MTIQTNETTTNAKSNYFNGVLYSRVFINEVKLVQPKSKKASQYCAINATLLEEKDGVKSYTTIDLIARGQKVKELLWAFNAEWPANRFEKSEKQWIADVNIGSIGHCGFEKRNGKAGAVLKGRLINIRSLKIGKDVVFGEMDVMKNPVYVSPAYINLIDTENGFAKASLLEGKVGEHDYQNINFTFAENDVFNQLASQGKAPKGFSHRNTNARIFALLEFSGLKAIGKQNDETKEFYSYLSAELSKVCHLSIDGKSFDLSVSETTKNVTAQSAEAVA